MKTQVLIVAVLAVVQLVHSAALIEEDGESSQITITKLGGGSHRVDFSETDTVGQLKAKISLVDGTPASNLILVFAGKQLLEDAKLLSECGIQQDSKVIFLQRPTKSPEQHQQQQGQTRPATNEGRTSSNGVDVQQSTSSESAIGNLFVHASTGDIFEVPADAELTVGQFKRIISLLINVPVDTIDLEYKGALLVDQRSLAESGLHHDAAVYMNRDQAAVRAKNAVFERVIKRVIADYVRQLNNNGQPMTKLMFRHDLHFTEPETVVRILSERIHSECSRPDGQMTLLLEAYQSEDLRVEFGYEVRGERKSTLANLNDGAQWVVEQAEAAVAIDKVFGESSPSTTLGPL